MSWVDTCQFQLLNGPHVHYGATNHINTFRFIVPNGNENICLCPTIPSFFSKCPWHTLCAVSASTVDFNALPWRRLGIEGRLLRSCSRESSPLEPFIDSLTFLKREVRWKVCFDPGWWWWWWWRWRWTCMHAFWRYWMGKKTRIPKPKHVWLEVAEAINLLNCQLTFETHPCGCCKISGPHSPPVLVNVQTGKSYFFKPKISVKHDTPLMEEILHRPAARL